MLSREDEIAGLHLTLQDALDRVANGPDAAPVLDHRISAAARRLADLLPRENDLEALHSRWLLGWVHWHRYRSRAGGGDPMDLSTAITQHAYCLVAGRGPLPEELLARVADELVPEGSAVLEHAMRTRDEHAVEIAADIWQRIVEATPRDHSDRAHRAAASGIACFVRFESFGDRTDLDRAESSLRASLLERSRDATSLINLGNVLLARCQLDEDYGGVDETIDTLRRGAAVADSDELRAACAGALVSALRLRFERTGDETDLAEAIRAGRDAVETTPAGHPSRPEHLSNLGTAFHRRFDAFGDPADLDDAIDLFHAAAEGIPADSPRRVISLSNLGVALHSRHILTASSADLDAAIEAGWAAVNHLDSDPYATTYLDALARSLHARFESTGSATDLDELFTVHRAMSAALPDGHPNRPWRLIELAVIQHDRFLRDRALSDLDQAIWHCRQAMEELPLDHPRRPTGVELLGRALLERFGRVGEAADLEQAIEFLRAAADSAPADSTGGARRSGRLAQALFERFFVTGDREDLDQSIRLIRAAIPAGGGSSDVERLSLLSSLAAGLRERFHEYGDIADLDEVIDMGQEALHSTTERVPPAQLLFNLGAAFATRHGHSGTPEDRDRGLAALEQVAVTRQYDPVLRIRAAHAGGILLAGADPARAAELLAYAVHLLGDLVPRHLETSDQQRELRDIGRVATDAAALALQDPSQSIDQRAGRALQLLETGRAILFGQGMEIRSDTTELAAQHPDLAARLESLRHTLGMTRDGDALGYFWLGDFPDPTLRTFPDPVRERRTLGEQYTALLNEIRSHAGFSSFAQASPDIDMPDGNLPGAVVVFNISRYRSDALLVTGGTVRAVSLPTMGLDAVTEQVVAFRQALRDATNPAGTPAHRVAAQRSLSRVLQWLWDNATGPVLEALGHDAPPSAGQAWPRIWWAPGGLLGNLPIHAAGYHNSDSHARSVLDRVVSSYTPTLRALAYAHRRMRVPDHDSRALIVSMPTTPGIPGRLHFVPEEVRAIRECLHNPCVVTEPEADSADPEYVEPFSRDELLALANSGTDLPPDVLPTRSTILTLLETCTMVHFACHAHSHPTDPSRSALLLHDEPLTVGALATVYPRYADLAYLSACETAHTADDQLADEGINLVSAFQLAGYTHVIGTLWEVDDDIATTIATNVYKSITNPDGTSNMASTAEILHRVVLDIRNRKAATPTLWAAHIHAGA
ncbi:CHAT domain-containing protein [Nocardia abscessus]|uniref:CHAT domain-containing protein n=1 Tax=Nocardia abscessus TaxID=120957 RepID=UPI0018961D0D|nr:CHAT domain-containing protein [Nocardia abscessus]MBF6339366.1 CHAT domain-containing protein [Nocardia abscessus]